MLALTQTLEKTTLPSMLLSQDIDEVVEKVGSVLAPHHMRMLGRHGLAADLRRVDLGVASIVYIEYGAAVELDVAPVPNSYLVHAALEGETRMLTQQVERRVTPGNLVVTAPGTIPLIRMSESCRHLCVRIDAAALHARAQAQGWSGDVRQLLAPETYAGSALPAMWRDLVTHIYRQAPAFTHVRDSDGVRGAYAAMLMDLLLRDQAPPKPLPSPFVSAIAPWHVRRACAIIDANLDETLSVASLAAEVGVSVRSLQNGFKQFKGTTPAEHIRLRRLHRLHEALQADQRQRSVTDLMLDSGIANFGRFAQYYRQQYGCLPSETLRRARMGVPA
jgi:AraC-like DNA-binding protein